MRLLIVEDEVLLSKQLKGLLNKVEPLCKIAGETNSISSTVKWLDTNEHPDLILMDIELADGQCFEIFNLTEVNCPVIFTTAYDEYALKAFKVNSIDYLLKPIQQAELQNAFTKLREIRNPENLMSQGISNLINEINKATTIEYRERFLVKQGQKMISINVNDVALFFSKNTLTFLVTRTQQKFVIDYPLDEIEGFLNPRRFFRVNRQFILADNIIAALNPWFNGKLKITTPFPVEEEIIVSRDKAPLLKSWMGQ